MRFFTILFTCLSFLLCGFALAQDQDADAPIMGQGEVPSGLPSESAIDEKTIAPDVTEPPADTLNATIQPPDDASIGVFHILTVGDALGGGLGAGLARLAESSGGIAVSNRFNESSGIARPEVFDWAEAISRIGQDTPFDAAVVLLGSNDRQDIRLGQFRYAFNTPDWIAAFKLQTDTIIDALKARGLQVYWVSIPPMQDPRYDADMTVLNDIIRVQVAAKGESFVDIRPAFRAADGSYVDHGPDDTGVDRKLRARDGVSFFKSGNNRMAQLVLAAVDERRKSGAVAVVPGSSPIVLELPKSPVLGQSVGNGKFETIDSAGIAEALASRTEPVVLRPTAPAVPVVAIIDGIQAMAGTDAEKLFTTGLAGAAPAGRFDDFSFQAPAAP